MRYQFHFSANGNSLQIRKPIYTKVVERGAMPGRMFAMRRPAEN